MKLVTILFYASMVFTSQLESCDRDGPGYFKFLSKTKAKITQSKPIELKGRCFQSLSFKLSEQEEYFEVEFFAKDKKSWSCLEFIIITSGNSVRYKLFMLRGRFFMKWQKKDISSHEQKHIREKGLSIMLTCDKLSNFPRDIFMTLKLFIGGLGINPYIPIFGSKIPKYQQTANIDMVKKYTGYEFKLRKEPKFLQLDKKHVKSGDFIAISRFDGLDNIINIGSGSRAGHTAVALWHENELYILESQDAWYWPTKGIQKTKWEDWIQQANNADFNVIVVPLKDSVRAKFNEDKAWEWFEKTEHLNYGFHNFLFGWLDSPNKNLPDTVDLLYVAMVMKIIEYIKPSVANTFIYEALNLRLGTKNLNSTQLWDHIYEKDIDLEEVTSMVEREGWQYSDGWNYVCSSYVISVYKNAGLFGNLELNSTEFTPKDLYELNIFDNSGNQVPDACKEYAYHGFCQIMGKIVMDLGKTSFVKPYSHMNEHCPTVSPDFNRTDGC